MSRSSTRNWGDGFPMDPGLGVIPLRVPTMTEDSVCPKASMSLRPVALYHVLNVSGLRGSPAMQQFFSEDRSWPSIPAFRYSLNIVGGQQNVVILCFSIMFMMWWGSNLSYS